MEKIRLISPTIEYDTDIMQFRKEIIDAEDKDALRSVFILQFAKLITGLIKVISDIYCGEGS